MGTFQTEIIKARKGHRCHLCMLPILKGSDYQRITPRVKPEGVNLMGQCTFKEHLGCAAFAKKWAGNWTEPLHGRPEFQKALFEVSLTNIELTLRDLPSIELQRLVHLKGRN